MPPSSLPLLSIRSIIAPFFRVRTMSTSSSSLSTSVRPVAVHVTSNSLTSLAIEPSDAASAAALDDAVALLRADHVVAFPTETVYGLGANALRAPAAQAIYTAKQRPSDNPLIVHVSSLDMLRSVARVPDNAWPLIERFWPGPLTLLLPRHDEQGHRHPDDDHLQQPPAGEVPDNVTCGLPTVAVRMPAHPVARLLIHRAGLPLAAPSANRSGRPSPTCAAHVLHDLDGRIPLILDGGAADVGVESTVVDLLQHPPALLRPGGVTYEQLLPLLPGLRVYAKHFQSAALEAAPTTPGMKYRHYSPDARVVLFDPSPSTIGTASTASTTSSSAVQAAINHEAAQLALSDTTTFAIVRTTSTSTSTSTSTTSRSSSSSGGPSVVQYAPDVKPIPGQAIEYVLSCNAAADEVARGLFKALRELDELGVRVILVEGISEDNEGLAVMNRLRKAASQVINV